MKHICNAKIDGYEFGISLDNSIDWPQGYFRLVDENDEHEIADGFETEQEAVEAIFTMYPDNDM